MAKSIKVTLQSTPFRDDPPDAARFYESVGRLIRLWSKFELNLGETLLYTTTLPEVNYLYEGGKTRVPSAFAAKAKLWRKLYQEIPILQSRKDVALAFITDAEEAALDRNAIVHSAWQGFIEADSPTIQVVGRRYYGGTVHHEKYTISFEQVSEVVARSDKLSVQLMTFLIPIISLHNRSGLPVGAKQGDAEQKSHP